jgi:Glycosyltransferase family 92
MSESMAYLSVCAIYRDEEHYLREWIEFHRLVGVERFFLYNNLSLDDHREVLAPYIEAGIVTLTDWPEEPGQMSAYEHCLATFADDSRWIAFLDLDEFLFSPTKTAVSEILAEFEDAPGVVVNWAVFGPADHATPPAGLLIENYTRRTTDPDFNHMVKSIVDPRRVDTAPGPHYFTYVGEALAIDENGDRVQSRNVTDQVSFSRLRINHYVTRSREEYERKQAILNAHTRTLKVPIKNYERRYEKLNEMQCDAIHVYLEDLRRVLASDPRGSRVS